MLCLTCLYKKDIIPDEVEGMIDGVTTNISSELKEMASELKETYPTIIYCEKRMNIVVGNPELPTQRVDECKDFAAA